MSVKEPEAKTTAEIYDSINFDEEDDKIYLQVMKEKWVRQKDAVAFAEARVKEATDELKQFIEDKKQIAERYIASDEWRTQLQARVEVDTYERILRFLEEAKQP